MMGHGEMHARHFRHGRFGFEPFYGFGLDYGYPDWYGGGESCYWNCRSQGNGPRFCRANAVGVLLLRPDILALGGPAEYGPPGTRKLHGRSPRFQAARADAGFARSGRGLAFS